MSAETKIRVTLKTVAERVGLAPCSISAVLNDTPASRTIPQATKDRIFRAAAELNYRPNFWARSLRTQRTRMVVAVTRDFGRPCVARVVAAAQQRLQAKGYLLVLSTLNSAELNRSPALFQQKGIEGLIAIDVALPYDADMDIFSVDLTYLSSGEAAGDGLQSWLSEVGQAAAEEIVRKIESRHRVTVRQHDSKDPLSCLWDTGKSSDASDSNVA